MADLSFSNLAAVLATAFAARLLLGLFPRVRLPGAVAEIVLGIIIGPQVLGLVEADQVVNTLAFVGLAFLLFLSGLELDIHGLRGPILRRAGIVTGWSLLVAFIAAGALGFAGLVDNSLLIAVTLIATSLGLVVPVLKESGHLATPTGQLVLATASLGDFTAIGLLSLAFSRESHTTSVRLILVGAFVASIAAAAAGASWAGRSARLSRTLAALQDTTAQIRVRGALVLVVGLALVAERTGLEAVLGAFAAGAIVSALDRDVMRTHPQFPVKMEAIGYGFLVPVFFVASGLRFNLTALVNDGEALALVPLFLLAMIAARGLPALAARRFVGNPQAVIATGLLQATSLPVIVTATMVGQESGAIGPGAAAAFVAAGLTSALAFPAIAIALLRRGALTGVTADVTAGLCGNEMVERMAVERRIG
jgi:Kef-type K+ transport system membrane component KefB